MHVLVADDDPVGRQMVATAIELLGHHVVQVEDGALAVARFREHPFEIVVLDWVMPVFDGLEAARQIRTYARPEPIATEDLAEGPPIVIEPMILLATAFDDPQLVAAALEAGIDDYLIKPLSMAEIRARLAVAVERHHLRRRTEERERALRHQRGQAEAVSQQRARFLANMSHELRTPLNGMIGMSDFLRTHPLSAEAGEAVDIIRASALSLGAIIDDILDLTQVDEGKIHLVPRPFDVRAFMQQIVGLYSVRAGKAGLNLHVEVEEGIPSVVVGDPTRIRQVLSNLVNNAIKFTDEGWILVRVAAEEAPVLRFSVADSGPGISPEDQAMLFDRFQRGQTAGPGHGLGLAISRGLTELMGGRIGIDSALGDGATFWVELPLPATDETPADEPTTFRQPRRPIRALVAEDDRFNQTVAMRLLERAGCEVCIADNGAVALDRVADWSPDIVFMDIQMPQMDGLEAARQIRALPGPDAQLPIVGLTASSVAGARQRCAEAGMDGYLQKPVRLAGLVDALMAHLPDLYD